MVRDPIRNTPVWHGGDPHDEASLPARNSRVASRSYRRRLRLVLIATGGLALVAGCKAGATRESGGDQEGEDGGILKVFGPSLVYQAENYTAQSGCSRATNNTGYSGSGFVDFGDSGTYVEWNNVNGAAAVNH